MKQPWLRAVTLQTITPGLSRVMVAAVLRIDTLLAVAGYTEAGSMRAKRVAV